MIAKEYGIWRLVDNRKNVDQHSSQTSEDISKRDYVLGSDPTTPRQHIQRNPLAQ